MYSSRGLLLPSILAVLFLLPFPAFSTQADAAPPAVRLYVAPDGDDAAAGAEDAPLATLTGARDALRRLREAGELDGQVEVLVRGGEYPVRQPIIFEPQDSGSAEAPITFRAAPGETPIIHGGIRVTDWREEGDGIWSAQVPDVYGGHWDFLSLWVNGARRTPARTPNQTNEAGDYPTDDDFFFAAGQVTDTDADGNEVQSSTRFRYRPGDLEEWESLGDAHLVIFHSWATSLLPVQRLDEAEHIVEFTGPARWHFGRWREDQWYYVEHLREALDQPGEWYVERATGKLYYMPLEGEDMATAEVIVPVAEQLLLLAGAPEDGAFVEWLNFDGLHFRYTHWRLPETGLSDSQAAFTVEAAVQAVGARFCTIERGSIMHTGNYALWWRRGSQDNRLFQCELHDLGAGGVRIGEGSNPATPDEATLRNVIDNNFIHDGGRLLREAVGVWIGRSSWNTVSHNVIRDFRYTGVSVGWSWGYAESSANHNLIEFNHIYEIGKAQLNDMGGIYTLGISPGTVLRYNLIHDIWSNPKLYGGWGLYPDEGSTDILLENNIVYDTQTGGFHQHYGRDNRVRNNIFAFSRAGQLIRTRDEDHNSFFIEHNIVYFDNGQVLGSNWRNMNFELDYNTYWDTSGAPLDFGGRTWEEWRAAGKDPHSQIADPLFVDPDSRDFTLREDSPALALGFKPIDTTRIGLYGDPAWTQRAAQAPVTSSETD